ncbi:CRISPR-associated protein Cas5 [Stenotrophomonas maltophilia]|nr:CRISPR-associated protein Cas5 [Stenotrophomonas sp. Ps181]
MLLRLEGGLFLFRVGLLSLERYSLPYPPLVAKGHRHLQPRHLQRR